jgi:hypothetical protein
MSTNAIDRIILLFVVLSEAKHISPLNELSSCLASRLISVSATSSFMQELAC